MKKFVGSGFGKIVILNLQRGDKLLECIEQQVREEGIKYGVILCAIGTVERVSYHRVVGAEEIAEDEFLSCEAPCELSSLQGLIIDGEPHIHVVFDDKKRTYAVHIEPGTTVLYTMEIAIAEIENIESIRREKVANGSSEFFGETRRKGRP